MTISSASIRQMRSITGGHVSIAECKDALIRSNGDVDAALEYLRKNGYEIGIRKEAPDAGSLPGNWREGVRQTSRTTAAISQLRKKTLGKVGIAECKAALDMTNGDCEAALDHLRNQGHDFRPQESDPTDVVLPGFWREMMERVLPDVMLMMFFVVTWIRPAAFGPEAPAACIVIMIMEFFSIHSTVFIIMASGNKRATVLVALFYIALFAVFYSAVFMRGSVSPVELLIPLFTFARYTYRACKVFT